MADLPSFALDPTTVRVGAYSVDPRKLRALIAAHPRAGLDLGVDGQGASDGAPPDDEQVAAWAVKQAVLRALAAPLRIRADWSRMYAEQVSPGRWTVTSTGQVRQFHEAHTLGHVDVTTSEVDGRVTAYAVLTRDGDQFAGLFDGDPLDELLADGVDLHPLDLPPFPDSDFPDSDFPDSDDTYREQQ